MKTTAFIAFMLISLGILAQGPQLEIKPVHNFGTLYQNDKVEYDFIITNTGDQPLIISSTKSSCGCDMAWLLDKGPIAPGDSVAMRYKYDGKRLGPINKSVTIKSNDSEHPYVVVKTKGNIIKRKMDVTPVR